MAGYTYPAAPASVTNNIAAIHAAMKNPAVVARRLRTLLEQRYIADRLLKGRFDATGGGIFYENGEPIGTGEDPRAVSVGGEYPLVSLGGGVLSGAKTTKWGQDTEIYDEAIARLKRQPVDRGLTKLANQNVSYVDGVAMSAITSAVAVTTPLGVALASADAEQILTAFLTEKARIIALDQGYMPDTVVLDDVSHAIVTAKFVAAGYFPRESSNPVNTGDFPNYMGLDWLATNHGITNIALVADTEQLGGMADEDLQSPGYAKVDGVGVEVKVSRLNGSDDRDGYRARARRVTVPVITESAAAGKINLAA